MAFRNAYESHEHSLQILNLIYGYDSFLDSLSRVADFGCGAGLDTEWWATLETRDEPPEPRNYQLFAVDQNTQQLHEHVTELDNVKVIQADFEHSDFFLGNLDLVWCHDAFQYVTNPLKTLQHWNKMMSKDGMLRLSLPQSILYLLNKIQNTGHSGLVSHHSRETPPDM